MDLRRPRDPEMAVPMTAALRPLAAPTLKGRPMPHVTDPHTSDAGPSVSLTPTMTTEDDPLSDEDESLLRELGEWHLSRAIDDAKDPSDELLIPPPFPTSTEAELEARVDVVLGHRRRKAWPWLALSHLAAAVAAAALPLVLLPASPADPEPPPEQPVRASVAYGIELFGGKATALSSSSPVRTYTPESTFELRLRTSRIVEEPLEVVVEARREDRPAAPPVLLRFGLEPGVTEVSGRAAKLLPLAAGHWELTLKVGAPDACLLPASSNDCTTVDHVSIELQVGASEGKDAP